MILSKPSHYTSCEGGSWQVWEAGRIDRNALMQITKNPHSRAVCINETIVHSLLWGSPFAFCARWDCINGFTKEITP